MGASVWKYLLEGDDLVAAIADKRAQVWESGDFALFGADGLAEAHAMGLDALLMASEGSGTHSLLDLVAEPVPWGRPGGVAVVPDDVLIRWVGDTRPADDPATIDALYDAGAAELPRWHGAAIRLYRDGAPSRWLVVGVTGD